MQAHQAAGPSRGRIIRQPSGSYLTGVTESEDPFENYKAVKELIESDKLDGSSPLLAAAKVLDRLHHYET